MFEAIYFSRCGFFRATRGQCADVNYYRQARNEQSIGTLRRESLASLGQRIRTCAPYRKRLLALPSWFIISSSINLNPRSPLPAWRR
jgi:hypothetical protein